MQKSGNSNAATVTGPSSAVTAKAKGIASRIWELDFLRGLAILLMVLYHLGFDLTEFCGVKSIAGIKLDLYGLPMVVAQNFFAGLFVVLCGISSTLSRSNVRRAVKILVFAMAVTVVTFIFEPSGTIYFGILHCLGVSVLLYALLFRKAGTVAVGTAGALILGAGLALPAVMRHVSVGFDWLMPFGVTSGTFSSYDYFPLLPWFGIFLLGTVLGRLFYPRRRSLLSGRLPATFINAAGRHTLLIYVVHQPIIMAVLSLARIIK